MSAVDVNSWTQEATMKAREHYEDKLAFKLYEARSEQAGLASQLEDRYSSQVANLTRDLDRLSTQLVSQV